MTVETLAPSHRWNLDTLYPGGAGGPSINQLVDRAERQIGELVSRIAALSPPDGTPGSESAWSALLRSLEELDDILSEAWGFALCTTSADVADRDARTLEARMNDLLTRRSELDVPLRAALAAASEASFEHLLERSDVAHMGFTLREKRDFETISMAPPLEELHESLARDGFHAWHFLYEAVSGALTVELDRGQGLETLGMEQAKNLLESTDQALREGAAQAIDAAWDTQKTVVAAALNHINGYRQTLYARRGIDELEVPLRENRLKRETLEAMLTAIQAFRPTMARYLDAKAERLGLDGLRWFDVDVPLGEVTDRVSYERAQQQIVEDFTSFAPDLGTFAAAAFRGGWIEAEDRAGKRHGGFCTDFPLHRQTRIFMTYGGTGGSVQTLAHELGHAYHAWIVGDLPAWQRDYPATLAETASTFAESIVREMSFSRAESDRVRLGMLDRKLMDAVAMVMNIPARFYFERALFAERKRHQLPPDRLCELVVETFDEAYHGALAEYDRMFWASKLHFYLSFMPFYNFPYAFGYLFSLGLFERARSQGPSFASTYVETLRLTGCNTVEDVAAKALGVDLTDTAFWESALATIERDVEAFVALS